MTPTVAIGDWHGNTASALRILRHISENYPPGTRLVHCGDFGFWDTNILSDTFKEKLEINPHADITPDRLRGFLHEINTILDKMDMTIYVTLGNHEDYWELDQTFGYTGAMIRGHHEVHETLIGTFRNDHRLYMTGDDLTDGTILDEDGFITSSYYPRIRLAPRAHFWEWDGIRYGSLGGANSIDILHRYRGMSWWEQEQPLESHAARLKELCGGHDLDVLITHDAPHPVSKKLYGHGSDLPEHIQWWAEKSGRVVEKAMMNTRPKLLFCGHHHLRMTCNAKMVRTIIHILDRENAPAEDNIMEIVVS